MDEIGKLTCGHSPMPTRVDAALSTMQSAGLAPTTLDHLRKSLLPPVVYASRTAYRGLHPLLQRALVAHAVPEALQLLEHIPPEQLKAPSAKGRSIALQAVLNDCDERILRIVLALQPTKVELAPVLPWLQRGILFGEESTAPWNAACRLGKRTAIQLLMNPEALAHLNKDNESGLHIACRAEAEAGALLLANSIHSSLINTENRWQQTPLQIAIQNGQQEVAITLLSRRLDADLAPESMECLRLLVLAAEHELEQVCLFLAEIASPFLHLDRDERLSHWTQAAFWAIKRHMHKVLAQLIPYLPESACEMSQLEERTSLGHTPLRLLFTASEGNNVPALCALLDRFVPDRSWNTYCIANTPFHAALAAGATDACKALIERLPREALLHLDSDGRTALHVVDKCRKTDIQTCRVLLEFLPEEGFSISHNGAGTPFVCHFMSGRTPIALEILKALPVDQLLGIPHKTDSLLLWTAKNIMFVRDVPVAIAVILRERMHPADFEREAEKARESILHTLKLIPGVEATARAWLSVLTPPLRAKEAEQSRTRPGESESLS